MPRKKKFNDKAPITDQIDKKAFGRRVAEQMAKCGYTNEMLAERIGVSISSVIAIKAGERLPGLDNYLRLLEAFECCDLVLMQDSISDTTLKCSELIDKKIMPQLKSLDYESLAALTTVITPLVEALHAKK